ncbi:MAG TPA: TonB family protein, partial [Pyrinomonadaceae bacterium]|nr:TonB family protein [Pyrinomonadaceae bacterium]
ADVTPKELVFVLDTSGSMQGFPIAKAKEAMRHALDGLNPQDTFNLITFSGDTHILFPAPVRATPANLARAQKFLESRAGGGGTEMMKAIRAALEPSDSQGHVRVVCFMTDGQVGNDFAIIDEVQKHPNARVFAFGIGNAPNRFLLDRVAEEGRGEVEYVGLSDDGSAAARRFHERVRSPVLTDISIDWGGLPVADIYPRRIPDLFSAKPVVITGRYEGGARGRVRLAGRMAGNHFERDIALELPASRPEHDVLATLWARTRVGDLLAQDYAGAQRGATRDDIKETITRLGLEYRLMTQYTSFVAVEEMSYTDGGETRRVEVPVELPEGMSPLALGDERGVQAGYLLQLNRGRQRVNAYSYALAARSGGARPSGTQQVGGSPYGALVPGVVSSGVITSKAESLPAPVYPPIAKAASVSGAVSVEVTVDEGGAVVSATPTGGHPLLQAAAVEAARKAKFKPTLLSGQPVKTKGIITYNFTTPEATPSVVADANAPTPEEQKRAELLAKLHPWVEAVVIRLEKGETAAGEDEAAFVREGRAEVLVWLSEKTPAVIEELKRLGFEGLLDPRGAKMLVGRVPIERLSALAAHDAVRYVAPQRSVAR